MRNSRLSLNPEMARHDHSEMFLRRPHGSETDALGELEEDACNQAPGGNIAVESLRSVRGASSEMRRVCTGSKEFNCQLTLVRSNCVT